MRQVVIAILLTGTGRAEIIDRVAVVVGRDVITQSQVEREARLETLFGGSAPDHARVLQRLIRQRLVLQEIEQTAPPEVTEEEIKQWLAATRPAGADPARHGLKDTDLREYGLRQLSIEKYVDLRFKSGLQASEAEIEQYYKTRLLPEFQRRGVTAPALDAVRERLESAVVEERVNQMVDEWMAELRQRAGVRIPEKSEP